MGQSSSRQQRPPSVATPSSSQSTPADPQPQPPRTPRRSVRRSLLNLVRPSQSQPDSNRRLRSIKSWRKSRRWSRAPDSDHSTPTSPQSVPQSLPSSSTTLPVESDPPGNNSLPKNGDGDERSHDFVPSGLAESEGQSGSRDPSLPVISPMISEHNATDSEGPREPINAPEAPVVYSGPPAEPTPTASPSPSLQPSTTTQQQQQQQQQQFQPPGTLVVVQGVVHTTDVPRPQTQASQATQTTPEVHSRPSSTPRSSTNRLSTLLQPSSSTLDTQQAPEDAPQPAPTPSSPPQPAETALPSDSESGTISSGSIDVLGTLLSVAAAATAASLLTGTTEGLNLPSTIGGSSTEPRPTSPTPTSGLDSTRGLRQAWGGIRERLGLRSQSSSSSSSPSHSTTNSPATSTSTSTSTSTQTDATADPREHLFSQMARAFNLGLGLATESAAAAREGNGSGAGLGLGLNNTSQNQTQNHSPPGEGSFERFLVDLQADLRTALTGPANAAPAPSATTENVMTPLPQSHPSGEEAETPLPTLGVPDQDQDQEGLSPLEVPLPDVGLEEEDGDDGEDDATLPELHSVTDSELDSDSDSEFEDASEDMHGHATEPRHDTPIPVQGSPTHAETPVVEANHNGRINWWRLYRFDSITISGAHGQRLPLAVLPSAAAAAASSIPSLPPSTQAPPSSPATATTSTPPVNADPSLAELPFADSASTSTTSIADSNPPAGPHVVVPVIVVGVQSVPAHWPGLAGHIHVPSPEDAALPDQQPLAPPYSPAVNDAAVASAPPATTGTEGTRGQGSWPARAADAIRNLRPGSSRRNRNVVPTTTGSRTFLIYVIGGYYPPNHGILTGGPESLASLEALLELAELFGHGKPQTATKEEIDSSGLEIIKTLQLKQYESEQKISSNCTERCLICLDDYEPEDDIRIMKCRHAFHQNCVDKWLETGRNNCPACRSRGVSLDDTADA